MTKMQTKYLGTLLEQLKQVNLTTRSGIQEDPQGKK